MIDLTGKTMASILGSMLLRVTEQVNKREGSLIRTALSAAAWAIEGLYIELIDVQKQAYGITATGEYLDMKAEERGVYRIAATSTVAEMKANLNTLPIGFQIADSNSYTWNITSEVISGPDSAGLYTYYITCQTAGEIDTPIGSLQPLSFYAGLTTAFFGDVVSPGTNTETDAALRQRYEESMVEIAFAGNVDAYREKILSTTFDLSGVGALVGALQVYPTTDRIGQARGGNVKVWILNSDLGVASNALVQAVQNEICPMYNGVSTGDGFGWAPIGANVHIMTATSTPTLSIDIYVTLSSSATYDAVREKIANNLALYIQTLKQSWGTQVASRSDSANLVVREAFIYAASLVEGVVDVTNVELYKNGVLSVQSATWVTNATIMEWIDDSETVVNIHQN
jgi:uncharacterized phage protein gp47/JayE